MSKIVALFPGQGSQHVGMARALYDSFPIAREAFEESSDAIKVDLKKLCFDGPESDLVLTENTQPCLLTASVAAFRVAGKELGFTPAVVAGHSLGEYSALVAAGALSLGGAARLVRARGEAMQKAVPAGEGAMAAVLGTEDETVISLCAQATAQAKAAREGGAHSDLTVPAVVEPANFNSPGQIVIAGSRDAVATAIELIKGAGGKAIPLAVSAPFHCSLMKPARERMAQLFAAAPPPHPLKCPYVPNRTARTTQESGVIYDLLMEQIDHSVLWKQSMLALLEQGYATGCEFGPGKVLQGLAKRITHGTAKFALSGLSDPTGLAGLEQEIKK